MGNGESVAPMAGRRDAKKVFDVAGHRGIGMFEFIIALLIFSMGMMGLLSAQLAGKKAGYEAAQRSIATTLVRDMLERMRANPDQIAAYRVTEVGDVGHRMPAPGADCDTTACSAAQLATFDVWQWESLLLGESEKLSGVYAGGLVAPRACIISDGGMVDVTISWLGATPSQQATAASCGGEDPGSNGAPGDTNGNTLRRRQLTISTFIVGRG
jgi:type IV pilus assembly protein PilV